MRTHLTLVLFAVLFGVAACSSANRAPGPTRPPAPPSNRTAAAPPTSDAASAPGGIRLDPQNTRIEFVGASERTSQAGSFQQFRGTFQVNGDDLQTARLTLDIDMDSTTTKIGLLTRHLKSKDFFDVPQYPRSTFVTTSIQPSATPEATHVINGNLTLHGVTRAISAPANITLANGVLTLSSRFLIRQSEFGMTEALKKTKDEVPITVSIRAARS
ncbi:MAG TPA: YceI family protein [Gemmataceae bacterium]|jgi:polyisoprenoid-binding protein YceI